MTDSDLLRRFVRDSDQRAFAELVRRHLDLVYAAGLRHVGGDTHWAEDIAQQVFVDLARKAPVLTSHSCLSGWLYASTRFTALNTVRGEQRRANREKAAEIMEVTSQTPDPQWEQIRPIIDDAMQALDEGDRQSVLLRFFGQQTFAAIGAQLGLSENAAQKKVDRALERLNAALGQRGITSTSAALGVALSHAGVAAPASLAGVVTAAALVGTATGSSLDIAGAFAFMNSAKFLTVVGAALAIGFVGGVWFKANATDLARDQAAAFQSRLSASETRRLAESKRADAAEADTARLLGAIEQARVKRIAEPPPSPPKTAEAMADSASSDPKVATAAIAQRFFKELDDGQFLKAWNENTPRLQKFMGSADDSIATMMKSKRQTFGRCTERTLATEAVFKKDSAPGATGEYAYLYFDSLFENNPKPQREFVVLFREADGSWKVDTWTCADREKMLLTSYLPK